MSKVFSKYLPKIAFFAILILLVLHVFSLNFIKIDNTTILLLVLLILSPFASSIKKIKWGDLEAEIRSNEVKKIEKEVKELPKPEEGYPYYKIQHVSDKIHLVLESDHILALANLRIEIEKLLNKILTLRQKKYQNKLSVGHIVQILEKENLVNKSVLGPIKEVISLCNRAIHGEEVREEDAYSIIETGLDLLDILYMEYYRLLSKPIKKTIITENKKAVYDNSKYEVTTVVPLVEKPYTNKYIFTQKQLDQFLEAYQEYAEFLVEIKRIEK